MLKYSLILFLVLILACSDQDISQETNIKSFVEDLSVGVKDLSLIRLSFGKCFASALQEKELRDFVKEKSIIVGKEIFNELIFSLIKDEKLPSGKTVGQLIKEHEDSEIKEIFGETLQERMKLDDPMLAIKLPDIFYSLDWDTKSTIPFVGVETPNRIFKSKYVFYYHNGYHELLIDINSSFLKNVKYFYIMVKYSSDFMYLNVNKLTNEKI